MKTEYLINREVELVLSALMPENRLVLRVMLETGMRISDVLSLRPWQLKSHLWITEAKTGKRRQIGFREPLLTDLRKNASDEWVFPGRRPGEHRTRQAVWKDLKRAAVAFRLPQNVGTHSMRKVYAVELMRKYGDIDRVRRALCHSNDAVTMIYALADMQLEAKYSRRRNAPGKPKT